MSGGARACRRRPERAPTRARTGAAQARLPPFGDVGASRPPGPHGGERARVDREAIFAALIEGLGTSRPAVALCDEGWVRPTAAVVQESCSRALVATARSILREGRGHLPGACGARQRDHLVAAGERLLATEERLNAAGRAQGQRREVLLQSLDRFDCEPIA
jgi:hypothetical protein